MYIAQVIEYFVDILNRKEHGSVEGKGMKPLEIYIYIRLTWFFSIGETFAPYGKRLGAIRAHL